MKVVILLAILKTCFLTAESESCQDPDDGEIIDSCGWTDESPQILLDAHNEFRELIASGNLPGFPPASNMMKMSWSEDLAGAALNHSKICKNKHSHPKARLHGSGYGQNIYSESGQERLPAPDLRGCVKKWFDEYMDYDGDLSSFEFSEVWGHFTQVAWWQTIEVGCGCTESQDGIHNTNHLTCDYSPPGNVETLPIYEEGEPCSKCTCDTKYPSLCVTTPESATTPSENTDSASENAESSKENGESPAENDETPAENEETPAENDETPAENDGTPAENDGTPAETEEKEEYPPKNEESPSESEEFSPEDEA